MYKFLVSYGNNAVEVEADDLYSAKVKGVNKLNVPKSKQWQVDIRIIKNEKVEINTADL